MDLFGYADERERQALKKPAPRKAYNGPEYDHELDYVRLSAQTQRIFDLMSDGVWRTLVGIEQVTGDPPASISAQLRHLRKPRFGSHRVDREHLGDGLYQYRLIVNRGPA